MEKSANDLNDITNNFNYVVLIHTKNHQNNDFDAFTRSNQLADNRAKMLAKAVLANKISRMRPSTDSETEYDLAIPTRQISQSKDNNDKRQKRNYTPQRTDKGSNAANEYSDDLPPTII